MWHAESVRTLTPTSFTSRLPGGPLLAAPGRREMAVIHRDSTTGREAPELSFDDRVPYFTEYVEAACAAFIGHDPFDIALVLTALSSDSRQDDANVVGSLPASELGWSLLATPRQAGPARSGSVAEAVAEVYDLLKAAAFISAPRAVGTAASNDVHDSFFGFTRLVRNHRFDDQERETLLALWEPHNGSDMCRELLGLGISDCLTLVQTVAEVSVERAGTLVADWPQAGDGSLVSFTAAEIARRVGLDPYGVDRALRALSVQLGEGDEVTLDGDTDTIRHAPILRHKDRFLLLAPELLLRAVGPQLERRLAERSERERERWQRRRARWVEREAAAALADFIRPDVALTNVTHDEGEVDALLAFDDTVLIVEVKGKSLRSLRRLSDPNRYGTDLRELVLDAIDELRRGRRALRTGAQFRDGNGRVLRIPNGAQARVIPIIITLEHFAPLSSQLWRLQRRGLIGSREPLPWMLSLANLQTICELLEWPGELIHFLHRRIEMDERVIGADEIDYVMAYLRWGLDFRPVLTPSVETVLLPNGGDEVNEWIFGRRGWWPRRAPRPQLELETAVRLEARSRVRTLDQQRPAGWVAASLDVLDWALDNTARRPHVRR
jgi:hypothetical protein